MSSRKKLAETLSLQVAVPTPSGGSPEHFYEDWDMLKGRKETEIHQAKCSFPARKFGGSAFFSDDLRTHTARP